jgi:alginate O-acetyltransferase complex protein AlgJ
MKKSKKPTAFFLALALIACIHMAVAVIELSVFPINAFALRSWESLACRHFSSIIGPFYPNKYLAMTEQGDLGHHTPLAINTNVEWTTDRYGYRKKDSDLMRYPILIIGDSNVTGNSLDQANMLSEMLGRKLNTEIYPLAPAGMKTFIRSRRFMRNPPDTVIVAHIERGITDLKPLRKKRYGVDRDDRPLPPILREALVVIDRVWSARIIRSFSPRLDRALKKTCEAFEESLAPSSAIDESKEAQQKMLFFQGAYAMRDISDEEIARVVGVLKQYKEIFDSRHIRFIYLPIPNKETIYFDKVPGGTGKRPTFLQRFIQLAKKEGIEIVDTESAFIKEREGGGPLLFNPDETHWNANGVRIAYDLLADLLRAAAPASGG